MKAEHRKQLETNTLADNLGKLLQGVHHGISRNVWVVLGILVVIILLFVAWRGFSASSQRSNAALWFRWDQIDDPDEVDKAIVEMSSDDKDRLRNELELQRLREQLELQRLEAFAKQNAGTTQSRIARFQVARLALFEGLRDLGRISVREQALKNLEKAAETYEKLIRDSRDLPILHQEALLNCGKANESLGKLDEARKYYQQLQTSYPKSKIRDVAELELIRLKGDATTAEVLAQKLTAVDKPPTPIPLGP